MPLNVIGLISGGKDSLFSLVHCIQNGHNVVALANLHPPISGNADLKQEAQDLDSFMYQTVGHSVVPLYAEALELPLYRRQINGRATQIGKEYDTSTRTYENDETEDLYLLIKEVLKFHPEAAALSSGAILSTYQRTRVESIALRLGLMPLAYLWQYSLLPPPSSRADSLTSLLDDMASSQCDARLIKLASAGIREDLLGSDVASSSTRNRLVSGLSAFFDEPTHEAALRGAVLGEGGEFETLALDGPAPLWKSRIELDFGDAVNGDAGTSYATWKNARTIRKSGHERIDLPLPGLLDARFAVVAAAMKEFVASPQRHPDDTANSAMNVQHSRSRGIESRTGFQLSNLTATGAGAGEQLDKIIDSLPTTLSSYPGAEGLTSRNIVFAMLVLRSMTDFVTLNPIYAKRLWPAGLPNPPARVTIAASLPKGVEVSLSLTYDMSGSATGQRDGLHVQSMSYWAPANIGPYSQAISADLCDSQTLNNDFDHSSRGCLTMVHMAGQIPLVPHTMSLFPETFGERAILALQHLWRIGQERQVDMWVHAGVAYLAKRDEAGDDNRDRAEIAAQIWRLAHATDEKGNGYKISPDDSETPEVEESDNDVDIWDLQQQRRGYGLVSAKRSIGDHLHILPNHGLLHGVRPINQPAIVPLQDPVGTASNFLVPPFIAAEISDLPRNAPIEWWSKGVAGARESINQKACKIHTVFVQNSTNILTSGIAVEHIHPCDEEGLSTPSRESAHRSSTLDNHESFTFLVAVLIDKRVDTVHRLTEIAILSQINMTMLQNPLDVHCRMVNAHAFVSRAITPDLAEQINESWVVRQACNIQCHRLWGSGNGVSQNGPHEARIEELAAAILLEVVASPLTATT